MISDRPWQNSTIENNSNTSDSACITISPSQFRLLMSSKSDAVCFARHILAYACEKVRSPTILLVIADEIQKYNVAVFEHKNEQNSLKVAKSLGQKIVSFFAEARNELPLTDREKVKIICWSDMLSSSDYDSKVKQIRKFINEHQTESLLLIDQVCKEYARARNPNKNLKKKELEILHEYVINELPALLFGIEYEGNTHKLMLHPILKTENYDGHEQRMAMVNLLDYIRQAYLKNTLSADLMCHIFDIEILASSVRSNDESSTESSATSEISGTNSSNRDEPSVITNGNTLAVLLIMLNFQFGILFLYKFWLQISCLAGFLYGIYHIYKLLINRIARSGQWQSISNDDNRQFVLGSNYESFFGDLPAIQSSENGRFMNDLYIKLNRPQVYRIWMGPEPALMLAHPQAVKDFWSQHNEKKVERDVHLGWPLEMLMGKGVGFRSMEDRNRITKYFHIAFGANQTRHFDKQIEMILTNFFNSHQTDRLASEDMKYLGHDAAIYLFLGEVGFEHLNELHSLVHELGELMIEAFDARWTNLPIIGYYLLPTSYKLRERILSFNKRIRQVLSKVIDTYRQYSSSDDENMCIAAHFARQTNPPITFDELTDTIVEGLIAPNDGTAGTFMYTLLLLGMHPNVQDIIRKELEDLPDLTLKSLNNTTYLDQVLSECQRLCPIFMFNVPEFASQSMTVSGVTIPKNTMVMLDVVSLNRNQASWGNDALSFRPERFAPPVLPATLKAYHGFGNGHLRRCLGQYLIKSLHKLFLARLLSQKQVRLTANIKNVNTIQRRRLPFIYIPTESVKLVQL